MRIKNITETILPLGAFAVTAATASAALINTGELVVNGGFETGSLIGWTTDAGAPTTLTTGTYGIGAFGSRFFFAGTSPTTTISQSIDISADATLIDAGTVAATLAGALGSWANFDIPTVTLSFLDGSNADLGSSLSITALDNPILSGGGSLTALGNQESDAGLVPAGTRTVSVVLTSVKVAGGENDGYADNLSVQLDAVPEPSTTALLGLGGLALIRRRRK